MKIRAAVLQQMGAALPYAESRPLRIEEVELDPPGSGEVRVRLLAAGLCHSDLSVITGERPRPIPMTLGHEACGEVLECGPHVATLKPGDRVVLVFIPSCGQCLPCMEGRPALCEPGAAANLNGSLLSGARRLHWQGGLVHHHLGVSAFAEQAVVSQHSCVRIDPGFDPALASLFGCAVLTGVGAVVNTARVQAGSTVAVVGLGGVGLSALLGAQAAGACEIIAVDLHENKLRLAMTLGATAAFNAMDPELIEKVKARTYGGVETAFETAGAVPSMEIAYRLTRRGGTTVTAGLPGPTKLWAMQQVSLVLEERTVRGSFAGSCVPLRDVLRFMGLQRAGKLPVEKLAGQRLKLDEINTGFDRLTAGDGLRDVIVF